MSREAEYLARYEAIAAVSRRMLQAARAGAWRDMPELQSEYGLLVDGLEDAERDLALDAAERRRKYLLLRRILADDAAIRFLADPQMSRLSAWFNPCQPVQILKDLYDAHP
jgi:flagellar protein FliT